jgi:DNA mismatch endonuclease (patch repair protein)
MGSPAAPIHTLATDTADDAASYPWPSTPAASRVMRGNRRTDTGPELRLRSELHRRGLRFRKDFLVRARETKVRPDIVFPRRRLAVFVDGCFWHSCPDHGTRPRANVSYWSAKLERNTARDCKVDDGLSTEGWLVIRIWEHTPALEAADQVAAALEGLA